MKILFLCTGNSCRSQMAEGWARRLKADAFEAYSAGIETHGLNPNAVKVMAEPDGSTPRRFRCDARAPDVGQVDELEHRLQKMVAVGTPADDAQHQVQLGGRGPGRSGHSDHARTRAARQAVSPQG